MTCALFPRTRSPRGQHFFARPPFEAIIELSAGALKVLCGILILRRGDEAEILADDRDIALVLRVHPGHVRRSMPELERRGWVRREDRPEGRFLVLGFELAKGPVDPSSDAPSARPSDAPSARPGARGGARPIASRCACPSPSPRAHAHAGNLDWEETKRDVPFRDFLPGFARAAPAEVVTNGTGRDGLRLREGRGADEPSREPPPRLPEPPPEPDPRSVELTAPEPAPVPEPTLPPPSAAGDCPADPPPDAPNPEQYAAWERDAALPDDLPVGSPKWLARWTARLALKEWLRAPDGRIIPREPAEPRRPPPAPPPAAVYAPAGQKQTGRPRTRVPPDESIPLDEVLDLARQLDEPHMGLKGADTFAVRAAKRYRDAANPTTIECFRTAAFVLGSDQICGLLLEAESKQVPAHWLATAFKTAKDRALGARRRRAAPS